jgi:hypothetical protein
VEVTEELTALLDSAMDAGVLDAPVNPRKSRH